MPAFQYSIFLLTRLSLEYCEPLRGNPPLRTFVFQIKYSLATAFWGRGPENFWNCWFKYTLPIWPLKCMLEGAAYYEGLFLVLDSKVASNLCLEDYSYGSWEFIEWNVQGRFFRAANKPVAFTVLYPRSSRAGHSKTLLDSLLQTY